jgi:hypothetical protein
VQALTRVLAAVIGAAALACSDPPSLPARVADERPWPMHAIDDRYRGANALGEGDVDGDGRLDFVTNYEFDQRYVIAFNPGKASDVRSLWPRVTAYQPPVFDATSGIDTETAALGDFDGDGNLDVAAGQGTHGEKTEWWEGREPGLRIVWGPPRSRAREAAAWQDGGLVPASDGAGHYHWVLARDIDQNGLVDVLAGGRINVENNRRAGIAWLEAPADASLRRDLSQWKLHPIDPETLGGHGVTPVDLDGDGDLDLLNANADFDTPDEEETIVWYENPGPSSPALRKPWKQTEIYRGPEFTTKPQLALGDLDRDGLVDFATQVRDAIYWFRATSQRPPAWERIAIPKPEIARWLSRPIKLADLDGDGRLDIIGMLEHEAGVIPPNRASVYWMRHAGDAPRADNWSAQVIKWGSGKTMAIPAFGEKWDQLRVDDVDADGDLDIVGNIEEWWVQAPHELVPFYDPRIDTTSVSVVWFENRLRNAPFRHEERDGVVAIEAENAFRTDDGSWVERSRYEGHAGHGYVQAHHSLHPWIEDWKRAATRLFTRARFASIAPEDTLGIRYAVEVSGGSYALWLRARVPRTWPYLLGGSRSNAAFAGIDASEPQEIEADAAPEGWLWLRAEEPLALAAGAHELVLKVSERGFAVDRIVLAARDGFAPDGAGPAETLARD